MKLLLLSIVVLFFVVGCNDNSKGIGAGIDFRIENISVLRIVSGSDTLIVNIDGGYYLNSEKVKSAHGHNDTTTGVFTFSFR